MVTVLPHFNDPHHTAIAEAAYFRAERRGFAPGHELEDWLEDRNQGAANWRGPNIL